MVMEELEMVECWKELGMVEEWMTEKGEAVWGGLVEEMVKEVQGLVVVEEVVVEEGSGGGGVDRGHGLPVLPALTGPIWRTMSHKGVPEGEQVSAQFTASLGPKYGSDMELAQPGAWQMEEGPLLAPASESAMEMPIRSSEIFYSTLLSGGG
ncbi:unnamed protein product [Gadus morhua 'NCC']